MTYFSLPLLLLLLVVNIKVQRMIESSWPQPLVSMVPGDQVSVVEWWSWCWNRFRSSLFLFSPSSSSTAGVPARPACYTARPGQPGQLESGARAADPFQGSKTLELFWYHLPFPAVK